MSAADSGGSTVMLVTSDGDIETGAGERGGREAGDGGSSIQIGWAGEVMGIPSRCLNSAFSSDKEIFECWSFSVRARSLAFSAASICFSIRISSITFSISSVWAFFLSLNKDKSIGI